MLKNNSPEEETERTSNSSSNRLSLRMPAERGRRIRLQLPIHESNVRTSPPIVQLPASIVLDHEGHKYNITFNNLKIIEKFGNGAFGSVHKVHHGPSNLTFALKRVILGETDDKNKLNEINIHSSLNGCENIPRFYGAMFWDNQLHILMELMDCSMKQFYCRIYPQANKAYNEGVLDYPQIALNKAGINRIPENVLRFIASSLLKALKYLHKNQRVIHRDIKPSNILVNRNGQVKLCDFGISGMLSEKSLVKTFEAGCRPYMAPEKIRRRSESYGIESDVWSFGLTMLEISIGQYPYPESKYYMETIDLIANGPIPSLPSDPPDLFTEKYRQFIQKCLLREHELRPKFCILLNDPFITDDPPADMKEFVCKIFD